MVMLLTLSMFAGCGTGKTEVKEEAAKSTETADTQEKVEAKEEAEVKEDMATEDMETEEDVVLTMWIPGTTGLEVYEQVNAELDGITVEVQIIPWGEYFTKLNVGFAGGTAPDIFGLGYGQMGPVQAAGNALALDEYLDGWSGWSDIPENIFDAGRKDGHFYGLLLPTVRLLAYRKDLFEAAGLDTPPKSLEEIKQYAEILTEKDGDTVTLTGMDTPTTNGEQLLFGYMLMAGMDSLWDEDGMPTYSTPEGIKVLEEINSYHKDGLAMYSDQQDITGTLFQNGLAAMSITSGSNSLQIMKEKFGADNFGVALPPNGTVQLGTFLAVNGKTEHKEAAVEAFKALTTKEFMLTLNQEVGFLPTRESAKDEFLAFDPIINQVVYESISQAKAYGNINPHFFDFIEHLRAALEKVYYGVEEAEEALLKAEADYKAAVEASE